MQLSHAEQEERLYAADYLSTKRAQKKKKKKPGTRGFNVELGRLYGRVRACWSPTAMWRWRKCRGRNRYDHKNKKKMSIWEHTAGMMKARWERWEAKRTELGASLWMLICWITGVKRINLQSSKELKDIEGERHVIMSREKTRNVWREGDRFGSNFRRWGLKTDLANRSRGEIPAERRELH